MTNAYDNMGNVVSRTWTNGKKQVLTWDGFNRLVKVVETGSAVPFTWTAFYDGLNRRIRTSYTPQGGVPVTCKMTFDPNVEFLELGVSVDGQAWWKIYGPDVSGRYGGTGGLGGLEAVVGSDGAAKGIVQDWHGNVAGYISAPGAGITWSDAQYFSWGPNPSWSTKSQTGGRALHEILGYRGFTIDPPGFVHQGLREYDPLSGRWLSADPLGHGASVSLYDYCHNDPVNFIDLDGRTGMAISSISGGDTVTERLGNWAARGMLSLMYERPSEIARAAADESVDGGFHANGYMGVPSLLPDDIRARPLGSDPNGNAASAAQLAITVGAIYSMTGDLVGNSSSSIRKPSNSAVVTPAPRPSPSVKPLEQFVSGIAEDAFVHFAPEARGTMIQPGSGGQVFAFRYGDIKHLTPTQIESVIGPLSVGGQKGGAAVMHVLDVSVEAAVKIEGAVVRAIPEYVFDEQIPVSIIIKTQ